jgi:hypothetical protein
MNMHPSKNEMQRRGNEVQERAAEALKLALSQVSTIKLKEIRHAPAAQPSSGGFVAHVDVLGHSHFLACEVESSWQLVDLEKQVEELRESAARFAPGATPVFIAPYLSPEAQAICKARASGFLDLEGNARIAVGEVFIGKRSMSSRKFERPTVLIAETFRARVSSTPQTSQSKPHRAVRPVHHTGLGSGTVATA